MGAYPVQWLLSRECRTIVKHGFACGWQDVRGTLHDETGDWIPFRNDAADRHADDTLTVRSVFAIGPDKKVRLTLTYPASTGRNFDELLGVIDSLQLTAEKQLATPADWTPGQDMIIAPSVSDDEARTRFGDFTAHEPYLGTIPASKA